MSKRLVHMSVLVAAAAVAVVLMVLPWKHERNAAVARAVAELDGQWVGRAAPPFALPDLRGQTHRLREYRGEVIFLNFWASFCRPCRREMPSMERLVRDYQGRGFEMLAVTSDPEKSSARSFLRRFLPDQRSAMTVLWDPESEVRRDYGTELIPETYIVDRNGRVVARFKNAYDWTRPEVKRLVETLMST